jgi:signal transduction histidine kinase
MRKKLNLITIPITLAIFGIMFFQVDWMFKTFNAELNSLNAIGKVALTEALARHTTEQHITDSVYLLKNFKKWADTVKMQYLNGGDSLFVQLENRHAPIEHPKLPGPFYAHVSLPTVPGVTVMSPSLLTYSFKGVWKSDDNEKNGRLSDSLKRFFEDSGLSPYDSLMNPNQKKSRWLTFQADSARILTYFKEQLAYYGIGNADKIASICFTPTDTTATIKYVEAVVQFKQNVLHRYPKKQWVGFAFPHRNTWVANKIMYKAVISVLLILVLVFSFRYLIKIIKQQKQLAEIKDDFIDNLTHEFKTPIATISAAIEGMQKFNALDDKEKTNRYLEISKNELTRLNDMVTKLLNISVYDKNNLTLTLHNIDMAGLFDEIVSMEKFRAIKPVKFTVDIDDSVKQIPADPLHFKNALINLVDNAVKYSKESVSINISGTKEKGFARFSVKDNGIGIPSTEIKNVFEKFYRVPTGDMHNIKGSGLGLSYVRSVIEAHGGSISVNSEINVQTEFIISIPLK